MIEEYENSHGDNMDHNFCRVADPADPYPWCYTTDPTVRFDYCDCSHHHNDQPPDHHNDQPESKVSQPICHGNAGTVTMPISFAYDIYDSHASRIRTISKPPPTLKYTGDRIYGGDNASPGQVPWQVNLMLDGTSLDNLMCGGTLISPTVRF